MCEKGLFLSPILGDGMILQRDVCNLIYGTDTESDVVKVYWMDSEYTAKVDEKYNFCIELPSVSAGGPYNMTIKGSSEIVISDILVGDVYLLSGQSNMELPIRRVLDVSEEEIKRTWEPDIRQYLIPASYNFSEPEKYMYQGKWKKAVTGDIMDFSAAGYFFAKEIKEAYQIPVGLIMTAVGGSNISSWMKPETLKKFGDYEKLVEDYKNIDNLYSLIQEQQNSANQWSAQVQEEEQMDREFANYKEWDKCSMPALVSDYGWRDFQGSVYLCKEVILDSEPVDEDTYIYMGSIIDSDKIWINGELVGSTEYRYPPRKYPVRKGILKKGKNLIKVRMVVNNGNGGTIKGKPYHLYFDGMYVELEGEWFCRIGKKVDTAMPAVLFPPGLPICFYHTVVVPLSKIKIKGVLWYQGESNTWKPEKYAEKFEAMVCDWRKLFGWEVPVIYVQLHNYREPLNTVEDSGWAALREQQRKNLSISQSAMVVAMDIGESNDLHPQNKKVLGVRLARAAKALIYKEPGIQLSPVPDTFAVVGEKVKIVFQYLENIEQESILNNFELAGRDNVFYRAIAVRKGNCVVVSSEQVDFPVAVRYAWSDSPENIDFYNNEGLPAAGFQIQL
ncbi:sialate O-acetylesterase [Anaeromicropila populeti]|uniref:Sialate O-acetylesterase n=1 Tax=Anaeromicropila populeti TaxID=37658 RepID=A0A1I6JHI6_9FIRM|nr:sialate O-acetylesterase [Anaeromicropila populeti]SFR78441.1 sialate O-acetylesterase [Anaeromicropila populeti]